MDKYKNVKRVKELLDQWDVVAYYIDNRVYVETIEGGLYTKYCVVWAGTDGLYILIEKYKEDRIIRDSVTYKRPAWAAKYLAKKYSQSE